MNKSFLPLAISAVSLVAAPAFAACYDAPIEAFFPEFADSIEIQQEVVAPRILWAALDADAEVEGMMAVVPRAAGDMVWPVVPDLAAFAAAGGTISYSDSESPDGAIKGKVATLRNGEDYLVNILFSFDTCWTLIGVMDYSR